MTSGGRAALVTVAAIGLTAVWLSTGPAFAQAMTGERHAPPVAEAMFTAIVFAPLLAIAAMGGRLSSTDAFRAGVRPWRAAAAGAALGLVGLALAVADARLAGTLQAGPAAPAMSLLPVAGLGVVAVQVIAEEALFRGLLQPVLARAIGSWPALVASAVVFAALHMIGGWSGWLAATNMLGGGLLFGLLAWRTGGIAGAVAAHLAWNGTEQLIVGLDPNPGVGAFGAWWNLDLFGRANWGGSADGLNASWPMALALAALVVPLAMERLASGRRVRLVGSRAPAAAG